MAAGGCQPRLPFDWKSVQAYLRLRYPHVQEVTAEQLLSWLNESTPIMLLDARSETEFKVSHIARAVWAETLNEAQQQLTPASPTARIVVYCSVGARSAHLANQLRLAGYPAVYNLRGGIFTWANDDRPLVVDGHETQLVHPYDQRWGVLLRRERWTPLPE